MRVEVVEGEDMVVMHNGEKITLQVVRKVGQKKNPRLFVRTAPGTFPEDRYVTIAAMKERKLVSLNELNPFNSRKGTTSQSHLLSGKNRLVLKHAAYDRF